MNRFSHFRVPMASSLSLTRITLAIAFAAIAGGLGCDSVPQSQDNRGGTALGAFNGPPAAPAGQPVPNGAQAEDGDAAAPSDSAQLSRDIEEADILKVVGDTIYALNLYKGLLIVDVKNPDAPKLVGELDLKGRGIEMYVVNDQVYAILSADVYYGYAYSDVALGAPGAAELAIAPDGRPPVPAPDFEGSQLAIIDASDPTKPTIEGKINLVGYATESRRIGDIIYVIGGNYSPIYYAAEAGGDVQSSDANDTPPGFVASIDVSDPEDIIPVEREELDGDALTMHTSETTLYAASQVYDFDKDESLTHIQAVDISDPDGQIELRGTVDVPGIIRNRFYLDEFEAVLRIVTESWGFGFRQVRAFTYDVSDLDDIAALGQADIMQDESLQAVRFDGPRGYVVTFLQVDPLFVLDLSDPENPAVAGHLEVPGFSTHIEPRGERLIAVGIDDTDGFRPAISYYNVKDPAAPEEIGRVILGPPGSYTDSGAVYDEKAFKIVDELGLIAMPFHHVDYGDLPLPGGGGGSVPPGEPSIGVAESDPGFAIDDSATSAAQYKAPECTNGVQLIDFDDAGLSQRGIIEHAGRVERVGVIGSRVFAMSQAALATYNIDDRDNPAKLGQADFFTNQDMPYYADECGYYPIDIQPGPVDQGMGFPFDILFNGQLCGTIEVVPGAALLLMMFAVKLGTTRRKRR